MNKENKNQNTEENNKQPLMSKGMVIALMITIGVVALAVIVVWIGVASNNNGIQESTPVSDGKPFDYGKTQPYYYEEECYCCFDTVCYECDCGDCDDCYCDDCDCCGEWDEECNDSECYDDCDCDDEEYVDNDDKSHTEDEDYSGEDLKNVTRYDIYEITSSSELVENGITYSADNLIDNSLEDAWIEGVDDVGVGQSVYIHLKENRVISGMKINAGYQRSENIYKSTSRPRSLLIEFSSGKSTKIELNDEMKTQSITLEKPVIAKEIKITIDSVYEGQSFSNTAISEISLF